MNSNQNDSIYSRNVRRVTEYLREMLLPLPDGERLPGIRTLMKRTRAGQISVTNALRELQGEGVIRVDPYRGIFRIRPAENDRAIRLLNWQNLDEDENSSFFGILYCRLRELALASSWSITVENVMGRWPEELAEELVSDGVTQCIIGSASIPDFAVCLKKRMKVCLELLPRHTCPVATELRGASDMTVRQLDYLFSRGYRRIGYMYLGGRDVSRYPVQVLRLLDYYRLMAEKGYQVNPDWVFLLSDLFENFEIGMERMMNSDPKPEALIVPGGKLLPLLYPYCRKHKIKVGKDLAVFACDDIPGQNFPEVTTITNNPVEIAETFWEMFLAAERGEKVESRCTELLIRTGQTVPDRKTAVK